MWGKTRPSFRILALSLTIIMLAMLAFPSFAQDEEEPEPDAEQVEEVVVEPVPKIFITGDDVTSPPSAILHVYGRDIEGNAIDFASDPLILRHEGITIDSTVTDSVPFGTLTVFLIDLPQGVEEQLPAIQEAIQQFAGPNGGMQEQVDTIAIYKVGETEPKQLLGPTTFHNEVLNFFTDGLIPEEGSTALRDSIAILLGEVETLKPDPQMATSVVVMSDGTDVVSTEYELADIVSSALEKDIAIHTVRVPGAGLRIDQIQQGEGFLQELSTSTLGSAALLEEEGAVSDLWSRIAAFRDHARLRFEMDSLGGGIFDVVLSLASDPTVNDTMTVEIPENQPQVFLNLPPGDEAITLQTLDEPVQLRLGATVTWLDGLEREISEARLRVNGLDVVDVPVDQLDDFTVEVGNLQFGPNDLELLVVDEQGLRATNLPASIIVEQGEQQSIPEVFQPEPEVGNIVLNVFLAAVVLAVLVGLAFGLRRSGLIKQLSSRNRSRSMPPSVTYSASDDPNAMPGPGMEVEQSGPVFESHLEVVESVSDMPPTLPMQGAMVRIGRSPSMCDIAFRDDLTVSRQHAVLMLEGYHYRLFDENSTSGSWVNGRQVPDYGIELADGDEIHLGAVHLVFRQP